MFGIRKTVNGKQNDILDCLAYFEDGSTKFLFY